VPVTLIVLPFFTQVIVFLVEVAFRTEEALGVGELVERMGEGDAIVLGDDDGEGLIISEALIDGDAEGDSDGDSDGDADGEADGEGVTAAATPVGNKLRS